MRWAAGMPLPIARRPRGPSRRPALIIVKLLGKGNIDASTAKLMRKKVGAKPKLLVIFGLLARVSFKNDKISFFSDKS